MRKVGDVVTYWLDGDSENELTGSIIALPSIKENDGCYIISGEFGWEVSEYEVTDEGYDIDPSNFGTPCWYVEEEHFLNKKGNDNE